MGAQQVLVIHGVGNHDRGRFETTVNTLNAEFPSLQMLRVFWGDVGGEMLGLADTIPPAFDDQGSEEALRQHWAGSGGTGTTVLNGESWISVMSRSCRYEATSGQEAVIAGGAPTRLRRQPLRQ